MRKIHSLFLLPLIALVAGASSFAQCRPREGHASYQIERIPNYDLKIRPNTDEDQDLRELLLSEDHVYLLKTPNNSRAYLVREEGYLSDY